MRIATWNVNSIRSRLEAVQNWLKNTSCDILLLQELKCTNDQFPLEEFEDMHYNVSLYGQTAYNGVAVLSKFPIEIISKGIPGFDDSAARYLECVTANHVVSSIYVPNGGEVNSDKYLYKLNFLESLKTYLEKRMLEEDRFIVGGDFNVALDVIDVFDPVVMQNQICFTGKERETFQHLLNIGFLDALRLSTPHQEFTWWDYRGKSLENNQGLRIDYIFISPGMIRQHVKTWIDKEPRLQPKASDHVPVICEIL